MSRAALWGGASEDVRDEQANANERELPPVVGRLGLGLGLGRACGGERRTGVRGQMGELFVGPLAGPALASIESMRSE